MTIRNIAPFADLATMDCAVLFNLMAKAQVHARGGTVNWWLTVQFRTETAAFERLLRAESRLEAFERLAAR